MDCCEYTVLILTFQYNNELESASPDQTILKGTFLPLV